MFKNRADAGKRLADRLKDLKDGIVVLAIPRGGAIVANEVAKYLKAPMDIIIPRKIGAPHNPELAVGAVTEDGTLVLNEDVVESLNVPKIYIEGEMKNQIKEIKRRMGVYRRGRPYPKLKNKTVILIDDGIATGATIKAAIRSIKKHDIKKLIVAIPVASGETVVELKNMVDEVVCLRTPAYFGAIGEFYVDFSQTSDEEVVRIMKSL